MKDVGSGVYAGTINADGYLEVEATKISGETSYPRSSKWWPMPKRRG